MALTFDEMQKIHSSHKGVRVRDRLAIIAEILELCKAPQKVMRVIYNCNLSHDQYKQYITELVKLDCLRLHDGMQQMGGTPKLHSTTDKGRLLLQKILELNEISGNLVLLKNKGAV